jgi:hypothetical protein
VTDDLPLTLVTHPDDADVLAIVFRPPDDTSEVEFAGPSMNPST